MDASDGTLLPCVDMKELDTCVSNCYDSLNSDCQREANYLKNCEDKCRESCVFIESNLNDKCVIHLMAHVNFLRSNIRYRNG